VSPLENTPGYGLIDFYMTVPEAKAGLEIGVGQGVDAGAFWLTTSGARIEYDLSLPQFDPANPTTTGRITKITLIDPQNEPWDDSAANGEVIFDVTNVNDPFLGNGQRLLHVAMSSYIGLFIEGYGICPRFAPELDAFAPVCAPCTQQSDCDANPNLNLTCDTTAGRCVGGVPAAFQVRSLVPSNSQEIKEFLSLTTYVRNLPNSGALPANYNANTPRRYCCVGNDCPQDGSRTCQ
jgi:hypothetical protein